MTYSAGSLSKLRDLLIQKNTWPAKITEVTVCFWLIPKQMICNCNRFGWTGRKSNEPSVCHKLWSILCGREWILPESKTPQLAETQGMIALALSTWKKGSRQSTSRSWKRRAKCRRDTRRESERRNNEEQTLNCSSWMAWIWGDARMQTLEPCGVIHIIRRAQCAWEKWRVRCTCLHTPSVTVDRHRL